MLSLGFSKRLPLVVFALLFFPHLLPAQTERIRSFDATITVHSDSTIQVRETIEVESAREKIRHGIYRDFPTRYKDKLGNDVEVGFKVLGVGRDGGPEPYHTEKLTNGIRIYAGHPDRLASRGLHTYVFRYETNRQLGFFADHDELYWNVTGNGWVFPMDAVTATVALPPAVRDAVREVDAYTGFQGERGKLFTTSRDAEGNPVFRAEKLLPGQGLTIVVTWPRGLIVEPSFSQKVAKLIAEDRPLAVGLAGLAVLLFYYVVAWAIVGRDPPPGTIMPLYGPPDNLSPAALRYLEHMGFDNRAFSAAILDLAAKGCVKIGEQRWPGERPSYSLVRRTDSAASEALLTGEEKLLAENLFDHCDSLALRPLDSGLIYGAKQALKASLRGAMDKIYFTRNLLYWWPGAMLAVAIVAALVKVELRAGMSNRMIMLMVLLGLVAADCIVVFVNFDEWKNVLASRMKAGSEDWWPVLFCLLFILGTGVFIFSVYARPALLLFLLVLALAGVTFLFRTLLKAPTTAGRRLRDRVDGFRMFLKAVEGPRLQALTAPAKTPELFERYLPYAIALGVEQSWAAQFSQVLAAAAKTGYSPSWYSGTNGGYDSPSDFVSSFAPSFAGTVSTYASGSISSSVTAPGSSSGSDSDSSSGSDGGGSSGGGGGGGGGGGW